MRRILPAGLASALALIAVLLPRERTAAAEPATLETLPPSDSAISAVIAANSGKVPATGEQLWSTLRKLGKFAQLPIPFSSVRTTSGLAAPRVVIAPVGGTLGQAEPAQVNFAGRLFLAANMERAPGGQPRVTSVEFISWNGARRAFDFGFIERMSTDSPRMEIVEGGKCFACHKSRGPILGVQPWSNSTHDDNLRYAIAHLLKIEGKQLPEKGPFFAALQPDGKPGLDTDRLDGMALASAEAPAVDSSVRAGAGILDRRDLFQLLGSTPDGRKVMRVMLAAILVPGVLDENTAGVRSAIDTAGNPIYTKFVSAWLETRKTPRLSALADVDPNTLLFVSGIRAEFKRPAWTSQRSPSPPGITQPNGSTWASPDRTIIWKFESDLMFRQYRSEAEKRAAEAVAKMGKENALSEQLPLTQTEIHAYDAARAAGYPGLATRYQPSNPKAFIRPITTTPRRLSELVSAPLLAETIGLTDGDRRFLIRLVDEAARTVGVKPAMLAKDVFSTAAFEEPMAARTLPDREEFKDRFVDGLAEVLRAKHNLSSYSVDRKEYASGPRYDPDAVAEKEAAIVPTSACLRCHDVMKSGAAAKFEIIPPLAFDPFDAASRGNWVASTNAKTRRGVLAKMIKRLSTDADMPPVDSPEHGLFRVKSAATFAEAKKFLLAEYDRAK